MGVRFDGALGNAKLVSNIFVWMTERDEGRDLALAIRQGAKAMMRV